ncbi:lipopolysaccharide biosynthesis protein [Niveispirillum sp. KHB5.9]|uniref:lipopolysaccharide biosynthesis protein n=1 Tax=Niveispirillum sp. KHB5.9 TaxID=3400269 RepID=UPI003A83BF68
MIAKPPRSAITTWFRDDRLRKLFGNAGILLGGKTVNAIAGLAGLAIAARALGVEQFGILVLIHTFTQTIGEIAKFQSWQAVLRYGTPALNEGRIGDFQRLLRFTAHLDGWSALAGTFLSVAVAWALGPSFDWPPDLMPAALIYVTSVLFMVQATPTGILRLIDRFDILSVQSTLGAIIRMVGGGIAWAVGGGIVAFLVAWYVATAIAGIYLIAKGWAELKKRGLLDGYSWRGDGKPMTHGFDGVWSFVWSTNLSSTLELAYTHIGTLAVGWMLGPREAALFRIARQLGEALAKPAKLLIPAIYPELSRMIEARNYKVMRSLIERSALLAGAGAMLALVICWGIGEIGLRLIVGPEFVPAYPVMMWLVAAAVVGIWSFPLEPVMVSAGEAHKALVVRLWTTAVYIPVLLASIHYFGLIGAGWARMFSAVLVLVAFTVPVVRWFRHRLAEERNRA